MKRHVLMAFGAVAVVLTVLLVLMPASSRNSQAPFLSQLKSQAEWTWAELRYQYFLHKFTAQEMAFEKSIEAGGAVRIAIPDVPGRTGAWMSVERAIESFASSNRIAPIRFERAGTTSAQVYVLSKDAAAIRGFVNSIGDSAPQHLESTPR
jgi:hypothetical protein